jgi:thiol-disulfide isomerase/thioredoxin
MRKLLSLSLMALAFVACEKQGGPGLTSIKISADGTNEIIIAKLSPNAVNNLDTLKSDNGVFTYELQIDTADFLMLDAGGMRIPFFTNGSENINISIEPLIEGVDRNYDITGNKESIRIKNINDIVYDAGKYIDSLGAYIELYRDSADFPAIRTAKQKEFEDKVDATGVELRALIDEDPANMANLFIWPQSLGQKQMVGAEDHLDTYIKVDSALMAAYPNNPHALNFNKQLERIKEQVSAQSAMKEKQEAIAEGSPAPDISLPDSTGQLRSLSELKGQVVLVDFWAAWCRPCRAANPMLVKIYNDYKDQGFTVMSVSFDGLPQQKSPREEWLSAIQQDGLSWPYHVSDLKGWSSAAGQIYGIQAIPFTVLVDQEGNIVAKNINLGELPTQLDALLAS